MIPSPKMIPNPVLKWSRPWNDPQLDPKWSWSKFGMVWHPSDRGYTARLSWSIMYSWKVLLKLKPFTSSWVIHLTRFVVESDSSNCLREMHHHKSKYFTSPVLSCSATTGIISSRANFRAISCNPRNSSDISVWVKRKTIIKKGQTVPESSKTYCNEREATK